MLRINLLPPYIYEGAKRRNVMILWLVILFAVIGGFVFAKMSIDGETQKLVDERMSLDQRANDADRFRTEAGRINGESAVVRGKSEFVKGAVEHSKSAYQTVLNNIKEFTWHRVLYDGMEPAQQSVTLPAWTPTLRDVGQYMMFMERNPEVSRVDIALSTIPGFPGGGAPAQGQPTGVRPLAGGGHDFTVVLNLAKPIGTAPGYQGGGGSSGSGGGGTGGGMGGGMGGGGGMGSGGGMPGMSSGGGGKLGGA